MPPTATAETDVVHLREEWIQRLNDLVGTIRTWADEAGWSTRRIEKRMQDSQLGAYDAPALLLQEETTRVLLEPIARSAPGVEGIVDLYLMPAYDDVASLYFRDGEWSVHYVFDDARPAVAVPAADSQVLSKETFHAVTERMKQHAASLH